MTHDEAMRIARTLLHTPNMNKYEINIRQFCDYILSGDMKREIENAAFKRAACLIELPVEPGDTIFDLDACEELARRVRSLIQPPAQRAQNG